MKEGEYVVFRILTACIHCKQYYSPLGYCKLKGKPVEGLDSCYKFDCKYGKPVEEKKMEKKEEEKIDKFVKENAKFLNDKRMDDYDENGIPYWELVKKPITADMREKSNWKFYKRNSSQKSSNENDEILLDDYEGKFKETLEMEIFLKALKITFWFFVYSGLFLFGVWFGMEFG